MKLSEKAKISPSATGRINSLAKQKRSSGTHVYNFAAGEPILPNHKSILQGASEAIENQYFPYPPVAGIPELRKIVVEWINKHHNTSFELEGTLVTCGGKFALLLAFEALLNPGDEVLLPAPYWVSFPDMVKLGGGIAKPVLGGTDLKVRPQDLQKHLTEKTKALIFNNACNPTGVVYTRKEIEEILAFAKAADLIVISDEVYSDVVYDGKFISCGSFPEYRDRVIVIQSCSKNLGMTGWRVGFAFGPADVINAMTALQSQSITGTSLISQLAAVAGFENFPEVNTYVKDTLRKRRDLFVETFEQVFKLPMEKPDSALYIFTSLESLGAEGTDCVKYCERMLEERNVAIVPGLAFGMEGYVRFAFGEPESEIQNGLIALGKK